jgi:hypothetical protein
MPAGVKQAAEKCQTLIKTLENVPQGLKPHTHFAALTARLKGEA